LASVEERNCGVFDGMSISLESMGALVRDDLLTLGHALGEYNRFGACSVLPLFWLHLYCFRSCTIFPSTIKQKQSFYYKVFFLEILDSWL
jgi:hypothetical protein